MDCAICLEIIGRGPKRILDCQHKYHTKCIYDWSIRENSCPKCRRFFDFDTNNQKDFLEWMDIKLENFNEKYRDEKERLIRLIEIVDTTLRLNDKGIKCTTLIYETMLKKIYEYENELNYSWFSWLCSKITFRDDFIVKYGWYNTTIKKLKVLSS
jgi:hypothetical protein